MTPKKKKKKNHLHITKIKVPCPYAKIQKIPFWPLLAGKRLQIAQPTYPLWARNILILVSLAGSRGVFHILNRKSGNLNVPWLPQLEDFPNTRSFWGFAKWAKSSSFKLVLDGVRVPRADPVLLAWPQNKQSPLVRTPNLDPPTWAPVPVFLCISSSSL